MDLVNVVMTLLGTHPVHDQLRNPTGTRFFIPGVLLTILHFGAQLYTDYLQSQHLKVVREAYNDIMYAMVFLKRVVDILLPLIITIGVTVQFPASDTLSRELEKFDAYLKDHKTYVDFSKLHKQQKKFSICVILSVMCSMIGCSLSIYYYNKLLGSFGYHELYVAIVYYSNFILVTMKVCRYLNGICIRLDMFKVVLSDIRFKQSYFNDTPGFQLTLKNYYWNFKKIYYLEGRGRLTAFVGR